MGVSDAEETGEKEPDAKGKKGKPSASQEAAEETAEGAS